MMSTAGTGESLTLWDRCVLTVHYAALSHLIDIHWVTWFKNTQVKTEKVRERWKGDKQGSFSSGCSPGLLAGGCSRGAARGGCSPGLLRVSSHAAVCVHRWSQFRELVDRKKDALLSALSIQNYHLECNETKSWIREKTKVIESTQDLGNDLAGVMALQRKLTGMERDLVAIEAKLSDLQKEAEKLESEHPDQAQAILSRLAEISDVWEEMKTTLKNREASLGEASKLQQFLRDLDDFQSWLSRTQTAIASEDMPNTLTEAEKLLTQHENIKNEIDNYEEDYQKMRDMGEMVTQGQTDAQYMFLRQRLQALDTGWNELHKMWENRQNLLSQSHAYQQFLRDTKQAEAFLNNQEYVLAHTEMPTTLEGAEAAIKKQEDFMTTMDANEEKINAVVETGRRLVSDGNINSDRIQEKVDSIDDRYSVLNVGIEVLYPWTVKLPATNQSP